MVIQPSDKRQTPAYYGLELGKQASVRIDEQMGKDLRILAVHHKSAVVSDIVRQVLHAAAEAVRQDWGSV